MPELFSVWESEGWEEPVIEERFGEAERTVLLLSFKKKTREKKSEQKVTPRTRIQLERLIHNMDVNVVYRLNDIAEMMGLKQTRTRELLKLLIAAGYVSEEGTTKSKRYKRIR